jgi:hypothetical protein
VPRLAGSGRVALVAVAAATLAFASVLAARSSQEASPGLPDWVPASLGGITIDPGASDEAAIGADAAVAVVRHAVFLDEGPQTAPEVYPVRSSGRIARYPIEPSPTGQVLVPLVEDAPSWLVVWRGLAGRRLARFGDWPDAARVDAVFLVDGATGDCCWVTRFLSGSSRLGQDMR